MPRQWTEEDKRRMSEAQKERHKREKRRGLSVITSPQAGVQVHCSVRVDMNDLAVLPAANIEAFMGGIATVLSVINSN